MLKIDPNTKATADDGIYGLPFTESQSKIVFIPVPWDVTTSYLAGTSKGPDAILRASEQMDLFDLDFNRPYEHGIFMQKISKEIKKLNKKTRPEAEKIINASDSEMKKDKRLQKVLKEVNQASNVVNEFVYKESLRLLKAKKIPVVIGGDHSTPFGAIKAYAETFKDFGILHIDAHSDTRVAYMGFEHSHASIMHNVMEKIPGVKKLVQVGIRDFCEEEYNYTKKHKKISVHFDRHLQEKKLTGSKWSEIAKDIISELPENIYLSFDIDGLDPRFCPNTGTPVAGGLDYHEMIYLILEIVKSGKKLVGFDLVEVAPNAKNSSDEWDANVGMRLLYKLAGAALTSQGLLK
jgi:agmatinase